MSAVPTTNARRIGDILLELGFVSEDALAKATAEQDRTGQPLGQILVDHGAITRLELASALAEQWSDQSASITLLPIPPPAAAPRRAPEPHDDDQYAARLQDAVAELAQRVGAGAPQPTEELDDRVTDLAERIEATVARTQRIEATLATLAESFEGVTGGVEEAFGALKSGMADLALDLARIDRTVAELGAGQSDAPATDPALAARLEELGTAVAALAGRIETLGDATDVDELRASLAGIEGRIIELAERPVADPAAIEERLEAFASRVENVVTPDEVVALHESLVAFEQRLAVLAEDAGSTAALDEQALSLAELRATVVELESRPVGDPELDERLARIETQFAERLAAKPDSAEIESLAARLETSAEGHESLATTVAQLGVRIDEMTSRDDGTATRLEELQRQVETVASTLNDVRQALAVHEEIGAPQQLAELGQSLATVRDEVVALARSVTPADQIDQLAVRLDDLAGERDAELALAVRLEALESTIAAGVVTSEALTQALAAARDELTPAPDPRVDGLTEDIAEVRARLAEATVIPEPATDPAVHGQLEALALRIEQLAGDREQEGSLAAKLDDLERRLPTALVTPEDLAGALARTREELTSASSSADVQQLAGDIATIREQIAKAERTPSTDPVVASELDTMSQRLRFMDARLNDEMATSSEVTRAVEALRVELAGAGTPVLIDTSELEGTVGELAARLDGLADTVATGLPGTAGSDTEELQRLVDERVDSQVAARVAELTEGLEERLAAAEGAPRTSGVGTGGDTSGLEDLLERNRMTIERLGLHLGEHDRALAELMRSRNLPKKLDDLAARVDEIAGGAAPAGSAQTPATRREIGAFASSEPSTGEVKALMRRVEDAEIASQADREKLMNRLERMASSIDWRLQRLEAAETAPASSDED